MLSLLLKKIRIKQMKSMTWTIKKNEMVRLNNKERNDWDGKLHEMKREKEEECIRIVREKEQIS